MNKIASIIISLIFFGNSVYSQLDFRSIKTTTETESTVRKYFDSSNVDPIEGIYKSTWDQYYKIAIKKYDDTRYLAIVLEAGDTKKWKEGNVKAYIEKSTSESIFSVRYLMGDKKPYETTAILKNRMLLSVYLPNGPYGTTEESAFLKLYPFDKTETKKSSSSTISITGSGFFISSNGLIATNAHVVNGAKIIKVSISSESGNIDYSAKLVLIDTKNDVAIIKIEDPAFKELMPLPYGIAENADIGEKAFTIGYPLNDVMGSNYKVSDGIISSKSGIADDVRYYQITIPIQPGNSGGPLFNSQGNLIGITSAKLNGKSIGVQVENVNYAIKSAYLSNLINMLPNTAIPSPTNNLVGKELKDQIKILKGYVCLIQVTN